MTAAAAAEVADGLRFPDAAAFVEGYLAHAYARDVSGRAAAWCPQWWRHDEAVGRLEALWRAWEALRHDPALGLSTWYRDHADHHMAVLLDPDGPFRGCSPDRGHRPREVPPLPCDPVPSP